ncbi:MAG: ATP-binding protein [Bacteroidota bacterium]
MKNSDAHLNESLKLLEEKYRILQMENEELGHLVYMVSHDLAEPLRTIAGFTALLADEYKEHFDVEGKQGLQFISDATSRMQNVIHQLLTFGSIGQKKEPEPINITKVIKAVKQDLGLIIAESGAEIEIFGLPEKIKGHGVALRLLFQNLIVNAIKFQKPGTRPTIKITAEKEGSGYRFAVSDNGIGIAKKDKEKIFVAFERLHNNPVHSGSGLGLAHCKKIVNLHGGEIWAVSELNRGSTFYFTIAT